MSFSRGLIAQRSTQGIVTQPASNLKGNAEKDSYSGQRPDSP